MDTRKYYKQQLSAPPCVSLCLHFGKTKRSWQKAETFSLSTQCTSMCLLLLKSFWQQGQETLFLSSSDSLFSSTSHSSTCSISSVLSIYIFWQIAHLQFSASLSLVSQSVSERPSILPMFASSRSSHSASSASSFTPRASFRTLMEIFFLDEVDKKLGSTVV